MSIDIKNIALENYQFAPHTVRIKDEDEYLFIIIHSTEYKRTKKDCDIIGKEIVARFNNHDKLIEALKLATLFMTDNVSSYTLETACMSAEEADKHINNLLQSIEKDNKDC